MVVWGGFNQVGLVMSQTEKHHKWMKEAGLVVVKRLHHCTVYGLPESKPGDRYFYVGTRGSLRIGTSRASSIPTKL